MPTSELRISGLIQASIIALVLGFLFRDTPATQPTSTWPFVLAAYGLMAAVAPWLTGGLGRDSFSIRLAAVLGLVFAAPVAVSAHWLSASPYSAIGYGCWALVVLWAIYGMASIVIRLGGTPSSGP